MTRWRKMASPIIFLVAAVLLFLGARWGYQQLTKPIGSQEGPPCVKQDSNTISSAQVWVQVYNTGDSTGLASEVSNQLQDAGFNTLSAKNSSAEESGTVIVGGESDSPEVQLVKGFFVDAQARGDGRGDGTVTVYLSDNYPGFNAEAPATIEVPGGQICIPAPKPSPSPAA